MAVLRYAVPTVAALALGAFAAFNLPASADPPVSGAAATVYRTVVQTRTVKPRLEGKPIGWWRTRAVANRKEANGLQRDIGVLAAKLHARWAPTVDYALRLAAAAYRDFGGPSYWKLRTVAFCESTLNPFAKNGQYLGLFQKHWSPFGQFSVNDPVADALDTAATVIHDGSWRQWACG